MRTMIRRLPITTSVSKLGHSLFLHLPQHKFQFKSLIILLLVVSMLISACDSAKKSDTPSATLEPEPTAFAATDTPAEAAYPQTYTDALDREVTISVRPTAIVSLAPSVTEILFAIGAGSQVVGRTTYDNYPPEAEALPTIGGFAASSISVETILDLEPDLVIAGSQYQAEIVTALADVGQTVLVIEPESLAEIDVAILMLGDITSNRAGATAVITDMQTRTAAVTEKIATLAPDNQLTVFYEVWHEPLMTATNNTFVGELIVLAGGVNIFGELDGTYPNVSAERIIEIDPQVILGPSSHSDQLTADIMKQRPGWQSLSAVTENKLYIVDGDIISRSGPRVVDALEAIAKALYPALFSE